MTPHSTHGAASTQHTGTEQHYDGTSAEGDRLVSQWRVIACGRFYENIHL